MKFMIMGATMALLVTGGAFAQEARRTVADGNFEAGWVVSVPSGGSDFFNTRYTSVTGELVGIHAAIADFGTTFSTFPRAGVYRPHLMLDPSGFTPDLSSAITESIDVPFTSGLSLFTTQHLPLPSAPTEGDMHAVIQFPEGDPGLLGIGVDSDTQSLGGDETRSSSNPFGSSGFSSDGYASVASPIDSADLGLGPSIDCGSDFAPQIGFFTLGPSGEVSGDYDTLTTREGEAVGLAFWGRNFGGITDSWQLWLSTFAISFPIGPLLPSLPCSNGLRSELRVIGQWPSGAGNLTLNFVAYAGAPGIIGSVTLTNEISLASVPDLGSGDCLLGKDDGTYESGWVASTPTGSSDYFSTPWGVAPSPLSQSCYSVMDFGGSVSSFPRSGQAPENLGVDPAGNTPDLSNPYIDTPLPFAPLTFVTTSAQLISRSFSPYLPAGGVLEFIQLPPGDSGMIGIGADTNSPFIDGLAGWSLDGYSTPANLFGTGNWGMRTQ